jgi:hypothetical protein
MLLNYGHLRLPFLGFLFHRFGNRLLESRVLEDQLIEVFPEEKVVWAKSEGGKLTKHSWDDLLKGLQFFL